MELIQEKLVEWLQTGLNNYQNQLKFKLFLTLGDYKNAYRVGNEIERNTYGIVDFLPATLLPIPNVNMFETSANVEFAIDIDTAERDTDGSYLPIKQILKTLNGFAREKNASPFYLQADEVQYQVVPLFELADDQEISMQTSDMGEIIPVGFSVRFVVTENIANGNSYELYINDKEINFEQLTLTKARVVNQYSFSEEGNTKGESLQGTFGIDFVMPQFLDDPTDAIVKDLCGSNNALINNVKLLVPNANGEKTTNFYTMKYGNETATIVRSSNVGINVGLYEAKPYSLQIIQDGNVELQCVRLYSQNPFSQPNEIIAENGNLYFKDIIKITVESIAGGYQVSSCKINGEPYNFGDEITVDSNIIVELDTEPLETYKLTISAEHAIILCERISSLNSAANIGPLQNNADIFEGDILKISSEAEINYTVDEIFVNSEELTSEQITVSGNITITCETTYYEPLTLTLQTNNVSVTIERLSSLYPAAGIGNISASDSIYAGDVLTFDVVADTGKEISEITITSTQTGAQIPYENNSNYIVEENVLFTADAGEWILLENNRTILPLTYSEDDGGYEGTIAIDGLVVGRKLRFSGYASYIPNNQQISKNNVTFATNESDNLVFSQEIFNSTGETAAEIELTIMLQSNNALTYRNYTTNGDEGHFQELHITKLEQWV